MRGRVSFFHISPFTEFEIRHDFTSLSPLRCFLFFTDGHNHPGASDLSTDKINKSTSQQTNKIGNLRLSLCI
jgi:hypothetical protein